ncbi:uncharacterized protein LOC143276917 [Babylonia areolata]|uniref:uncharacterized protein LOC143276917 n=1 Tax=Babylonia areolata TaxID=304850 RepID=UPI003FD26A2E
MLYIGKVPTTSSILLFVAVELKKKKKKRRADRVGRMCVVSMAERKVLRLLHFRLVAAVAGVLLLTHVVPTHGCCAPRQFFGPVRVLRTTVAPGMPDTNVTILTSAYDADHKRVAIGYEQTADDKSVYVRNILDYGKGLEFLVTGNWYGPTDPAPKCTVYPLKGLSWRNGACVPANATRGEGVYMGHPNGQYIRQMDAVTFTHVQGSLTAKVMVTQDTCTLVGEVVYDTSDPAATRVINRLYVNQSMYEDDNFFQLPNVTCLSDPNPPKMTVWQRVGLFGWLLGLPDN